MLPEIVYNHTRTHLWNIDTGLSTSRSRLHPEKQLMHIRALLVFYWTEPAERVLSTYLMLMTTCSVSVNFIHMCSSSHICKCLHWADAHLITHQSIEYWNSFIKPRLRTIQHENTWVLVESTDMKFLNRINRKKYRGLAVLFSFLLSFVLLYFFLFFIFAIFIQFKILSTQWYQFYPKFIID